MNIKKFEEFSENFKYHLEIGKPITENIFRSGSESFFNLIKEGRFIFDNDKSMLSIIDIE